MNNLIGDRLTKFILMKLFESKKPISQGRAYAILKSIRPMCDFDSVKNQLSSMMELLEVSPVECSPQEYAQLSEEFKIIKNDSNLNSFNLIQHQDSSRRMCLRIAPNPNSSPAVGSIRMLAIHKHYTDEYDCKVIIRFDDTDPDNKLSRPCCYQTLLSACEWMGLVPDELAFASLRDDIYSNYIERLIKADFIYSNCNRDDKLEGYYNSTEQNLRLWFDRKSVETIAFRFKSAKYVKPELRNWVCYRRVKNKHPVYSNEFTPTVNFQSTVDDFEMNVTHMLRGLDLESTEARQRELWDRLVQISNSSTPFPIVKYWGRLCVPGTISSSSKINIFLENKSGYVNNMVLNYSTIQSFNLPATAFYRYFIETGFSRAEHNVNLHKLRSYCLKSLDRPIIKLTPTTEVRGYTFLFSDEVLVLPEFQKTIDSMDYTYKLNNRYLLYNSILKDYYLIF